MKTQWRNPLAATRLAASFADRFDMLAHQPLIGEACNPADSEMRNFPHGNYVIYYEPVLGGVRILRVVHGAREQQHALDEAD
jgi:toxin ParE1/3/4